MEKLKNHSRDKYGFYALTKKGEQALNDRESKKMIKTKSFSSPIEESDGTRIIVSGGYPTGYLKPYFDEHYPELAPTKKLLYDYKYHGLPWEEFEIQFFQLMKGCRAQRRIEELARRMRAGEVLTLLCFEKSDEKCHRRLVKELIEEEVEESVVNKIICGDCVPTMDGISAESVDLIVTSPPYNIGIEYDNYNDSRPFVVYYNWCKQWLSSCYRVLKNNRRIALNVLLNMGSKKVGRDLPCVRFSNLLEQVGFNLNSIIIWEDETRPTLSAWGSWMSASSPYIYCPYEVVILASKGNWKRKDKGTSDITADEFKNWIRGTWKFSPQHSKTFPTPFPEELPRRCIKLLSYVDDVVLDPFAGSGTTCLAAKKLNRRYIGIDLSPHYCKLARNRLKIFF